MSAKQVLAVSIGIAVVILVVVFIKYYLKPSKLTPSKEDWENGIFTFRSPFGTTILNTSDINVNQQTIIESNNFHELMYRYYPLQERLEVILTNKEAASLSPVAVQSINYHIGIESALYSAAQA